MLASKIVSKTIMRRMYLSRRLFEGCMKRLIRIKRSAFSGFVAGLVLSLAFIAGTVGQAVATHTVEQPGYDPSSFTEELQSPDSVSFDIWQITGRWTVSVEEVQAVLESIDPGRYSALEDAGTGHTFLNFAARYSRAVDVKEAPPAPDSYGPSSSLLLFVVAKDNMPDVFNTDEPNDRVILTLLDYQENPVPRNAFFEASVARKAEFKWKIQEEDGVLRIKVTMRGKDDKTRFTAEITADANNPGANQILAREKRPFRLLSDGPGGTHPTIIFGRKNGLLPVASIKADLHGNGGKLMTPGGTITVDDRTAQEGVGGGLRRLTQTPAKRCSSGSNVNCEP